MPKKFGLNSKSAEARQAKDEKKAAEDARRIAKEEEEAWRDDDKHVNKKVQRKENKDQKRLEQLERKRELQRLADMEMNKVVAEVKGGAAKSSESTATKTTLAELQRRREEREEAEYQLAKEQAAKSTRVVNVEDQIEELIPEENPNRANAYIEGHARSVEEAISVLSVGDNEKVERHVEKRMGMSYKTYEEKQLPKLKAQFPGLRMSQLKQMCWKQFEKSPDNPKNQDHVTYNHSLKPGVTEEISS